MKKITLALSLLLSVLTFAQVPEAINYQGIARNSSGVPLLNQALGLRLSVRSGGSNGPVVYQETFTEITNPHGLYTLQIGRGTPTTGTFGAIVWNSASHYLEVEIDVTGGTNYVTAGTSELISVPYALYAERSGTTGPPAWLTSGNSGANPITHFLGTTDNHALEIRTNNIPHVRFTTKGQIEPLNTTQSVLIGEGAGTNDLGESVFIGHMAGHHTNVNAGGNTALGYASLQNNTTGKDNTAIGNKALHNNTDGKNNVAAGFEALHANSSGENNVASGYRAMYHNTSAVNGTATGFEALYSNTSGNDNTANGSAALRHNTTGQHNTADGYEALYYNITGNDNTANGRRALYSNISGHANTANGYEALHSNITGTNNVADGFHALYANTTGGYNVANGVYALHHNTSGTNSTATGYEALYSNTTGTENTANGSAALRHNLTGEFNTANGARALYSNTTGKSNTANGYGSLYSNLSGDNNTANGFNALHNNTNGKHNVADGFEALYHNTSGENNVANGYRALYSNTSAVNVTATGYEALYSNTTGNDNTAYGMGSLRHNNVGQYNTSMGYESLYLNTSGISNTANGRRVLYQNTTGMNNTANGTEALHNNTTGSHNSAFGYKALHLNTLGEYNVANGYEALHFNTTGTHNTGLGFNANVSSGNLTNATALGANAVVNANNKIMLGSTTLTLVESHAPYNTISDGRFKTGVTENEVKGLDFIKRLRPVVYNVDTRKLEEFLTQNMPDSIRSKYLEQDFTRSAAIRQSGFIAQEVEAAAKASGYDFNGVHAPENENDNYSLAYGQFVVPLVKGMQEQQQMIEQLKNELQDLKTQLAASTGYTAGTLQVFPNPGKGLVTITTPAVTSGTIEICTLEGKTIYSQVIAPGTAVQQLDLTTQAKGVYLAKVISEGKVIGTQKLIIE